MTHSTNPSVVLVGVGPDTTAVTARHRDEPPGLVVDTGGLRLRLVPAYGLSADEVSALSAAMAAAVSGWLADLTRYAGELRAEGVVR